MGYSPASASLCGVTWTVTVSLEPALILRLEICFDS